MKAALPCFTHPFVHCLTANGSLSFSSSVRFIMAAITAILAVTANSVNFLWLLLSHAVSSEAGNYRQHA